MLATVMTVDYSAGCVARLDRAARGEGSGGARGVPHRRRRGRMMMQVLLSEAERKLCIIFYDTLLVVCGTNIDAGTSTCTMLDAILLTFLSQRTYVRTRVRTRVYALESCAVPWYWVTTCTSYTCALAPLDGAQVCSFPIRKVRRNVVVRVCVVRVVASLSYS